MAKLAPAIDATPEEIVQAMVRHGPIAASDLTMAGRSSDKTQSRSGEVSNHNTARQDDRAS